MGRRTEGSGHRREENKLCFLQQPWYISLSQFNTVKTFFFKTSLCWSVSPSSLCPFPHSLPPSLPAPVGRASLHYTLGEKWLTFIFLWSCPRQGQTGYATGSPKAVPKAVPKPPRLNLGPPVLSRTLSVGPGPQRLHWANGNHGWQLVTLSYSSLLDLGPSSDNGCHNPC